MRETADLTRCPACGSHRIVCVIGDDFDFCMKCHKLWERIGAGEHFMIDGEQLAFVKPCDNCAFRGGSVERLDKERWAELQQQLAFGGSFYCHKGVPLRATIEELASGAPEARQGFDFPMVEASADIVGQTVKYQAYDRANMRMCRGWLNAFIHPLMKGARRAKAIDNETSGTTEGLDREPA